MLNSKGEILYVGKARNLKKRVSSYFRGQQAPKTASLMSYVASIETIITQTENEALLLENNLIKKYKPRYNILLRDDKSYPYIVLTEQQAYPRLTYYRGRKNTQARYFGPYLSTSAVRETLNLLQKLFRIRSCEDTFFRARTRPCLQYQIKRCTAPCIGLIEPERYQQDVRHVVMFLEGKNQGIINELVSQMDNAASELNFEKAALYRDQIAFLRQIQQQQAVDSASTENTDAIAVRQTNGCTCVQIVMIRHGRVVGSKSYFPSVPVASEPEEILAAFLSQYYLQTERISDTPRNILLNYKIAEQEWLGQTLREQVGKQVILISSPRGDRERWLQLAERNAEQALSTHLAGKASIYQRLLALQEALNLPSLPQRLECFDISHSQGEATVASCVVFDENGPRKTDYRRFNIENIMPGDDYAAMQQALSRRYARLKKEEAVLPDILIIDGGKGQLKQAETVLEELQVTGITLLGIAKGPTRKAGLETLFLSGCSSPLNLANDSLGLHLLQQIRDEAHRFAISGHRNRRDKKRQTSSLENITGIGAKRRRELLRQFGGLQQLKSASIEEIAKVPGISLELAERIYQALQ